MFTLLVQWYWQYIADPLTIKYNDHDKRELNNYDTVLRAAKIQATKLSLKLLELWNFFSTHNYRVEGGRPKSHRLFQPQTQPNGISQSPIKLLISQNMSKQMINNTT